MKQPLALLLLLFGLAFRVDADDNETSPKFLLKYHFKPGQFVHYDVENSSTMTIIAKQHQQTTKETRQSKKHFRVVSVASDGSAVLEPVIDHVSMTIQNDNNEPIKFDSSSTEPPAKVFRAVKESIGQPLVRLRYQTTGTATEVLPVSRQDRQVSNDPEQHAFLTVFPDHPVAVGESWLQDFKVPVTVRLTENRTGQKKIAIRRRYTLKEVVDDIALVEFRIYPLDVVREPDQLAQLVQRSLNGTLKFDLKSGQQIELISTGSGQVHGAIGPDSSVTTTAKNYERIISDTQTAQK